MELHLLHRATTTMARESVAGAGVWVEIIGTVGMAMDRIATAVISTTSAEMIAETAEIDMVWMSVINGPPTTGTGMRVGIDAGITVGTGMRAEIEGETIGTEETIRVQVGETAEKIGVETTIRVGKGKEGDQLGTTLRHLVSSNAAGPGHPCSPAV